MADNSENVNPFVDAPVIYSYSRAQAIGDGELIDVTETAKEAGFKYPVAVTQGVMSTVVHTPETAAAQGESDSGRLWDVLWMCAAAARGLSNLVRHNLDGDVDDRANHAIDDDSVTFELFATDQHGKKVLHRLWSKCGPGDAGEPVVTIMLQGED